MNKLTKKIQVLNASSSQLTGVYYSTQYPIARYDSISFQFNWTAGTSGQILIDASDDFSAPIALSTSAVIYPPVIASSSYHFFPWIASSSLTYNNGVPNGSSGVASYSVQQSTYDWVQFRFIGAASTTGTLTGYMFAKDI